MALRLFLLFTIIPLVELYVLLALGSAIGFWPTLGTVIVTAVLGTVFAKREGLRVVREWQSSLAQGRIPEEGVVSGLLVVVAGALLIAPGILTDTAGLLLMIGPVRRRVARWLEAYAKRHIEAAAATGSVSASSSAFTFRVGAMPRARVSGMPAGFGAPRRVRIQNADVVEATGEVIEERRPDARRVTGDVIEGEIVED
jgi:UPF0716 protein FxsA